LIKNIHGHVIKTARALNAGIWVTGGRSHINHMVLGINFGYGKLYHGGPWSNFQYTMIVVYHSTMPPSRLNSSDPI